MSHISTSPTASSMGALDGLIPNSGTSPVGPDGGGDITLVTNTPGAEGTSTIAGGTITNPTTTVGSLNTVTITQNVQTLVSGATAAGGTLDIFTYTQQDNSAVTIFAQIAGIEDTLAIEGFGGTATCNVSRAAASSLEYELVSADGNDIGVDVAFVVSGADVILRLTGSATVIYNWTALITYIQVAA